MFITYDTNGDGDLQPDEFAVFYTDFMKVTCNQDPSPAEIQGAIIELDEDKNGEISLEEFTSWWRKVNSGKDVSARQFVSYAGAVRPPLPPRESSDTDLKKSLQHASSVDQIQRNRPPVPRGAQRGRGRGRGDLTSSLPRPLPPNLPKPVVGNPSPSNLPSNLPNIAALPPKPAPPPATRGAPPTPRGAPPPATRGAPRPPVTQKFSSNPNLPTAPIKPHPPPRQNRPLGNSVETGSSNPSPHPVPKPIRRGSSYSVIARSTDAPPPPLPSRGPEPRRTVRPPPPSNQ